MFPSTLLFDRISRPISTDGRMPCIGGGRSIQTPGFIVHTPLEPTFQVCHFGVGPDLACRSFRQVRLSFPKPFLFLICTELSRTRHRYRSVSVCPWHREPGVFEPHATCMPDSQQAHIAATIVQAIRLAEPLCWKCSAVNRNMRVLGRNIPNILPVMLETAANDAIQTSPG